MAHLPTVKSHFRWEIGAALALQDEGRIIRHFGNLSRTTLRLGL